MKSIILLLAISILCSSVTLANNANLFSYDAQKLNQEFSQLQVLEDYITANPGIDFMELQVVHKSIFNDLNLSANSCGGYNFASEGDPLLGLPAYYWGCCLGLPGLIYVLVVSDDSFEKKRAYWGCFYNVDFWLTMWLCWYYLGYY